MSIEELDFSRKIKGRGRELTLPDNTHNRVQGIPYYIFGWFRDSSSTNAPRDFKGTFVYDGDSSITEGIIKDTFGVSNLSHGFLDLEKGVFSFIKSYHFNPRRIHFDYEFKLDKVTGIYLGRYKSSIKDTEGKAACFISPAPQEKIAVLNSIFINP